ncbi:hypothetical protein PF010_g29443 [Phytophthora fragariae]|uniref:Timeless N-terminal domain-containing protein n=4 Tax=Phytophthora TaxID=4783 RepID=A0A6A3YF85_9STRA|nr:hypothetical protein PF003_g24886 [Phytophthora fragariae]KAE8932231.1 hypothetical protein PF009_g17738 [Phytophthora fragariae]KAE9062342.1 hypothetical protein PF010_g29443 [Phytophthora fragariae]KAE9216966.1 hypothetical protein PF002_g16934 [Phytophthora fragariae]
MRAKWKILQNLLLQLLVNHQYDWALVFSVMKVLVVLTMMPPRDSTNTAQQLLVYPLSRKGSARTGQDYRNMEIVLTLIQNLLAVPNKDPRFVTSTTSHFTTCRKSTLHAEIDDRALHLFGAVVYLDNDIANSSLQQNHTFW